MTEPLTKEERDEIDVRIAKMYRVHHQTETHETLAQAIRRYEATVQDRDDRIVALEAELARLREKAELGEAVEGMPVGFGLSHAAEDIWLTWDNRGLDDEVDETCGQTALATLRELAALRAAKGEDDE